MKNIHEILQSKNKGQTIVLVAISLVIIFALAALAIDVGISYNIKTKLNAAVDGAALAAGRAVKQGTSDSERENNARNAAAEFFSANYPSGYMKSTVSSGPTTNVVHNTDGSWSISVSANAIPPLYFARAVGWNTMNVHALAETTVRDLGHDAGAGLLGIVRSAHKLLLYFPEVESCGNKFHQPFFQWCGRRQTGAGFFCIRSCFGSSHRQDLHTWI